MESQSTSTILAGVDRPGSIHLVQMQPELLVLELKADGTSRYLRLRRDDLLQSCPRFLIVRNLHPLL